MSKMTKTDYRAYLAERGVKTAGRTSLAELQRLYVDAETASAPKVTPEPAPKRRRSVHGEPLVAAVGRVRLVVTGADGTKTVSLSNAVAAKVLRDAMEGKMPKRAKVGRTRVTVFADGGKCLGWFDPTRLEETAKALAN